MYVVVFAVMAVLSDMNNVTETVESSNTARVGDILPKTMGPAEMCRAFGIQPATFRRLQALGDFRPFLLPRPIGRKKYSGEKVQRFLDGRK
jgi:hypothetical protein